MGYVKNMIHGLGRVYRALSRQRMEDGGDSLESHSALCNYSHGQMLKNDPGFVLTPRKETLLPTAQVES